MGSDALYLNMQNSRLYKLDILKELQQNDFDSLTVSERFLSEYLAFELANGRDFDVFEVLELENESDVWRQSGQPPDLLCAVFDNCCIEIFDRTTGDLLKIVKGLPPQYSKIQSRRLLSVAVRGDQLVVLVELRSQTFHGPLLLYLDEKLEYGVRAQINMPQGQPGLILAASFTD